MLPAIFYPLSEFFGFSRILLLETLTTPGTDKLHFFNSTLNQHFELRNRFLTLVRRFGGMRIKMCDVTVGRVWAAEKQENGNSHQFKATELSELLNDSMRIAFSQCVRTTPLVGDEPTPLYLVSN